MRIVPASSSPFLPYSAAGTPAFPSGPQPLLYLHHQYGFATDGSEWTSRVGAVSATQPTGAKRPVQAQGGIFSDGTRAMQTGVLPLASAPALTLLLAFAMPLGVGGVVLETGPDYHQGKAFNLFSETSNRLYSAYVNGAETAETFTRTTEDDTVTLRLKPAANSSDVLRIHSLVNSASGNYYTTGTPAYGLIDGQLNLFSRNNSGSGPVGLLLKQVLIFAAEMTDAQLNQWVATF